MGKKVFMIHTSAVSYNELRGLFAKHLPGVQVQSIIDDSLLEEVKTVGHITPDIIGRMCAYFRIAEQQGADLIFNQCSSVGEAAEIAAKTVNVPMLRVDRPMAEKAVQLGKRIAVVATVAMVVVVAAGSRSRSCLPPAPLPSKATDEVFLRLFYIRPA